MGFGSGMYRSKNLSLLPLGIINYRCRKDKYNNDVSEILMADGRKYNMVHHSYTYATIYAGRNKFSRVRNNIPRNDCVVTTLDVGGYKIEWGDGDVGEVSSNPKGV